MELLSYGPFRVAALHWRMVTGSPALTVVCKVTLRLHPGKMEISSVQEEPWEEDTYWDDDSRRSLSMATDFVPYKAKAEVLLVGSAFAPDQKPARSWTAQLMVGPVHKVVEVHADRAFGLDGELRESGSVTRVPLLYERAAGGPDSINPVGMRFDVHGALGTTPVANLQPPGVLVSRRGDTFAPVGFGPIAPGWPSRRSKLHGSAIHFGGRGWNLHPLPEGVEPVYFNAAPHDQHLDVLSPDERITLVGLHSSCGTLVTRLPGIEPTAVVERKGRTPEPLGLVCDTLWIDTDRSSCHLVWRGRLALSREDEIARILIRAKTDHGMPVAMAAALTGVDAGATLSAPLIGAAVMTLPFPRSAEGAPKRATVQDSALPFGASGEVRPAPAVFLPQPSDGDENQTLYLMDGSALPTAPPAAPPPPKVAPMGSSGASTSPSPEPVVVPRPLPEPAFVHRSAPLPPPVGVLPPPLPPAPEPPALRKESIGERMAQQLAQAESKAGDSVLSADTGGGEKVEKGGGEKAVRKGWKPLGAKKGAPADAAQAGVLAASNAAVPAVQASLMAQDADRGTAQGSVPAKEAWSLPRSNEAIELLWLDAAALPRVKRQPVWKELLQQLKPKPLDDEPGSDAPPEKKQDARDRREMAVLLSRGETVDIRGVEAAMSRAVNEDGIFVPPLVLMAGELTLPFDEVEVLKATLAAVSPLVSGDVKLQAAVDTAQKLLQTAWLTAGASEIAQNLTAKVKEAFGQAGRAVSPRYLDHHTERILLQQRAYQKRTILGKSSVRGVLTVPGAKEGLPVYLPEDAAKELPALLRFQVKLMGEARSRMEEDEERAVCVRVVGMGRLVRPTG